MIARYATPVSTDGFKPSTIDSMWRQASSPARMPLPHLASPVPGRVPDAKIDGERQHDLTWLHIPRGEDTSAHAIFVARPGGVELVLAETGRGERAPIAVRRVRFTEAGDDDLDGPGYFFNKRSATGYPASAGMTVEQVLEKELSRSKK